MTDSDSGIGRAAPPPADGERNAVLGYSAQYRIAAELIYTALLGGDLEWIRVADPDAGRVDDIQIGRTGRTDAYQVKWGEYEDRVTFRALVTTGGPASHPRPSPFAQLADGWTRLSRRTPERAVDVHLVMRASASTDDDVDGTGRHFQMFLRQAWVGRSEWETDVTGIAKNWTAAIALLRSAAALEAGEFPAFVSSTHLHLNYRLNDSASPDRVSRRRAADIDQLAALLFRTVADERRIVELDRAALVRLLGWTRRLDMRFRHDFPIDDRLYRPVEQTVSELEAALEQFRGGYLALIGTPGSGKSTTLTQMLRYRPGHRVIRYYAFLPDDTAQGRGEAEAFLSDLTLAISRSGASVQGQAAAPETRFELKELFGRQLAALRTDWQENGIQTLILVDGLDHVSREQRPEHPFLDVLPSPEAVPEGVILVLGSQSVGLMGLPLPIRSQLAEAGRTVAMSRLGRRHVVEIAASTLPRDTMLDLDPDALFQASAGHPLALAYILKRLMVAADPAARRAVLDGEPFEGDVERTYRTHWLTLRDDAEVRDLLGLLCRLRGSVDLDFLASLTSEAVLERFVENAGHFFHQETASRWTFFHNSFRQYLLEVTRRDGFGRDTPARDASFHQRLATACSMRPDTPIGWERLHHLHQAGDFGEILRQFTQAYFRKQFMALRPLSGIRDDVTVCLKAAVAQDDRLAVLRALLIEHELGERDTALKEVDLDSILFRLAAPADRADIAVRDGALVLMAGTALAFAGELLDGDPALARKLFDLAEPTDLLSGTRRVESSKDRRTLRDWAKVAWRFHGTETLTRLMRQAGSPPLVYPDDLDAQDGNFPEATAPIDDEVELLGVAAGWAMRARAEETLVALEAALSAMGHRADAALARLDHLRAELAIQALLPRASGTEAIERLCIRTSPDGSEPREAITLALMLLCLGGTRERVEAYAAAAPEALAAGMDNRTEKGLDDLLPLFAQARVLSSLGRPMDPATAVPNDPRVHHHGAVLLQRMLVLMGTVRGLADAGTRLEPATVVRRLSPALGLFKRSWQDARDWTDWHSVRQRAESYFDLILRTAHAHSPAALLAVLDHLRAGWTATDAYSWPSDWKRALLLSAYRLDHDSERTVAGLEALSGGDDVQLGVHDRVAHQSGQLLAWIELGERERARAELELLLRGSFGVHHRDDDHYERWCGWAARVAAVSEADRASRTLLPFVRGMVTVHGDRRGHDPAKAVSILVEAAASIDPGWAVELLKWLSASHAATREAALAGFMKGILVGTATEDTRKAVLLTAAYLAVPFETSTDKALATALGRAACSDNAAETTTDELGNLLRSVATKTYPSKRVDWQRGLIGGMPETGRVQFAVGETSWGVVAAYAIDPDRGPPGLFMADGTFVDVDEVHRNHGSPDSFAMLAGDARSADRLPWEALLATVLKGADGRTHSHVGAAVAHLDLPLHANIWFAVRLAEFNRIKDARVYVDRAWAASKSYGWLTYLDGGSRLAAARAAIAVDGEAGRRNSLELFVRDYLGEARNPGTLLRGLDGILDLLFAVLPLEEIWSEVEEHSAQLIEVAHPAGTEPPRPETRMSDGTSAIVSLAFWELDHPVRELAGAARKLLLGLLSRRLGGPAIEEHVRKKLATCDDAVLVSTLEFLRGAFDVDVGFVGLFASDFRGLAAGTASGIVRAHAGWMLKCLGLKVPSRPRRPLPSIYTLRLPPAAMPGVSPTGPPRRGQPLSDTNDPVELAGTMTTPIARLSNASGIARQNLVTRTAALMTEVFPRTKWDRSAEERTRNTLDSAGLKIAYVRPRSIAALHAFGRVLQEVADAGKVTIPVPGTEHWLFAFDPLASVLDAKERPSWIVRPEATKMNPWSDKEWADRPENCLSSAPFWLSEGSVVLAERTVWVKVDSGRPTETRATQVGPYGYRWNGHEEPDDGFFYRFPRNAFAADYPMMWPAGASVPTTPVLEGGGLARPEFLAFSPAIAFRLGWRHAVDGLFAWDDESGTRMVETLFWSDGNLVQLDHYAREEVCCEGWAVLATPEGARRLQPLISGWRRYLVASRIVEGDAEERRAATARREQASHAGAPLDPITCLTS